GRERKHAACCLLPCRRITNSKESGNSSSLQSGARAMVQLSLWGLLSKEREASLRQPLLRELLRLPVRVPSVSVASRLVMTRPVPPPASWQVPARLSQPWRVGAFTLSRLA